MVVMPGVDASDAAAAANDGKRTAWNPPDEQWMRPVCEHMWFGWVHERRGDERKPLSNQQLAEDESSEKASVCRMQELRCSAPAPATFNSTSQLGPRLSYLALAVNCKVST